MNEHDVFKAKLKNEIVDFGHIRRWEYKAFQEFLRQHNFVYKIDGWRDCVRKVKKPFAFTYTYNTAAHLPFAWVAIWLTDIFNKSFLDSRKDYVIVRLDTHKDPIHDYIVIRNDMPFAL